MKDERRKKKKKPEGYIDLFADDDEEEAASVGSLFSDDEEDEAEDYEAEAAREEAADGDEEPAAEDGEDEAYPEPDEEPSGPAFDEPRSAARETFTFDRFGRRTGKVPKKKRAGERYGKRKHAKRATTTLLLNETEARREREEAQKRASERDKLREKQRRLEAERRRAQRKIQAKKRLSALLVLLGLGVLALLAGYFTFLIRSIDVVGFTTRYTEEDLIAASGLRRQRHILQQDLDAARENLKKDPYLNTTVKYVFPNRIRITVEERNRAGAVAWGPNKEYIAVIDREGVVLESDAASYPGLPLVQGLIITGANPGARVGDPADEQVQSMLDVLSTLEELGLADKIKTVDLTETMGISLYTPVGPAHQAEPAQEELHRHHGQGHPVHGPGRGRRDHLPVQQERRGHLPPRGGLRGRLPVPRRHLLRPRPEQPGRACRYPRPQPARGAPGHRRAGHPAALQSGRIHGLTPFRLPKLKLRQTEAPPSLRFRLLPMSLMGHRAARAARSRKNATRSCMHTRMSLRLTYFSLPFFLRGPRARGYTALM